jgi:hypothetical protein
LVFLALFLCLGYYGSRELYDPGYLRAVWQEELTGIFFKENVGHGEDLLYYTNILIKGFQPGIILLLLVMLTVLRADPRRRSISTLCLSCAATILVILQTSQTKIYWYATPILPFLAIAAALGVTDGLRWIKAQESHLPTLLPARPIQVTLGILVVVVSAASIYRNQVLKLHREEHLWYGALFDELQARGYASVFMLDPGGGWEGSQNYNPVLKFYSDIARTKGLRVEIPPGPPASLPTGELVATCDPKLVPWLNHQDRFSVEGEVHSCIFGVAHF